MLPQRMGIETDDPSPLLSAAPMVPGAFQLRRGSVGNSAVGLSDTSQATRGIGGRAGCNVIALSPTSTRDSG